MLSRKAMTGAAQAGGVSSSGWRRRTLWVAVAAAAFALVALGLYPLRDGYRLAHKKWLDSRIHNLWLDAKTLRDEASLRTQERTVAMPAGGTVRILHLGHTKELGRAQRIAGLHDAILAARADVVFLSGDLVWDAGNIAHWRDQFFALFAGVDVPLFTVPANHDAAEGLRRYAQLVRPEPYYKAQLGPVTLVALTSFAPQPPQQALLQQALQQATPVVLLLGGDAGRFEPAVRAAPAGKILFVATGDGQPVQERVWGQTPVYVANEHFARVFDVRADGFTAATYCVFCDALDDADPRPPGY